MSKITLQCVKEKNKLRVKFFSYIDNDGKIYTNVYNNKYNCRFPRDIRKEGLFYEIGINDINLIDNGRIPFYNINKNNIKIIDNIDINNINIYKVEECVICLDNDPNIIFLPCGHQCCCNLCYEQLKDKKCLLCRRIITSDIII